MKKTQQDACPYFFKMGFIGLLFVVLLSSTIFYAQNSRVPLEETVENSARYDWEHKTVLDSMLLDDAENPANWYHDDYGTMTFSTEYAKDGKQSIKLQGKTKGETPTKDNRSWGYCSAIRPVMGEDWSDWNRLSLWIYPDLPGHKIVSVYILVVNDNGKNRSRDNIILKNQEWNHIVSEIEFLPRDKVTGVEIRCRMQGNEPGTSDVFTYYVDRLELQKVQPDHYKGWDMAPGKIAYSHTGYATGSEKSAIASNLSASTFSIINAANNKEVLTKAVNKETTYRGDFQILEFSELDEPGSYYIKAGNTATDAFRIDDNIWLTPLEKALNFYYVLRVGYPVPGVHDASTTDWHATNGDKTVSLAGGWYDAGDLSQGLNNTAEGTYFMFQVAEKLSLNNENALLVARLIEEAKWGLDWILNTTLHDGLRPLWAVQAWWSNGIVGDYDDPHAGFGRSAHQFMKAAAAEAIAYRLLKNSDPELAVQSLKTAEEDWRFALESLDKEIERKPTSTSVASSVIASVELYKATSKQEYADKAFELAPQLINSQERSFIPGSERNITGYLYENTTKERTMHLNNSWDASEHNQIKALAALCQVFPDNSEWMNWYSGVAMYADLHKNILDNTAPYNMLPAGIYKDDEYKIAQRIGKEIMQAKLQAGQSIGDYHIVKAFPAHDGHFGNLHLLLAQTIGMVESAHLRKDLTSAQIAEKQLEWIFGKNPFSRSLMYGEGYDYLPLYSPMCGDIVGALPVGMSPKPIEDIPFWPAGGNEPAPKEQWVQTEQLFIYAAGSLLGPGVITGHSGSNIKLTNKTSGNQSILFPDKNGDFRAELPQGQYLIKMDSVEHDLNIIPNGNYFISNNLSYNTIGYTDAKGAIKIEVSANGSGEHSFEIRTNNIKLNQGSKKALLTSGNPQKLVWTGTIDSANSPWYAVVVPDGDISQRKEVQKIENHVIDSKGNDSLRIGVAVTTRHLMKLAQPAFVDFYPQAKVSSYIHETGNVVDDVIMKNTLIAVTTRNLKDFEIEKSAIIMGTPIGIDGLVLAVSNNLPINNLTFNEIVGIWTGKYNNWNQLGGPELPITVIGRTKAYDPIRLFADFMHLDTKSVEGGAFYKEKNENIWGTTLVEVIDTDDMGMEKLINTPGAITYFPLQVLNNYKLEGYPVKDVAFDDVKASYETIENGQYHIHRRLNVITNGTPEDITKAFVDFILSKEGQQLVEDAGFLKLKY